MPIIHGISNDKDFHSQQIFEDQRNKVDYSSQSQAMFNGIEVQTIP